jgi:hypothetical protein
MSLHRTQEVGGSSPPSSTRSKPLRTRGFRRSGDGPKPAHVPLRSGTSAFIPRYVTGLPRITGDSGALRTPSSTAASPLPSGSSRDPSTRAGHELTVVPHAVLTQFVDELRDAGTNRGVDGTGDRREQVGDAVAGELELVAAALGHQQRGKQASGVGGVGRR